MLRIGQYNKLAVVKTVDFGVYLDGGNGVEILLPAKYVEGNLRKGDEIEVFVYTDSEDRLIATTEHPYATVGQFAYLQVASVTKFGAFLQWGLIAKDLLVPFREQKSEMKRGGVYLVYVYLDDATKRVVASAKIEKFIGNKFPKYRHGEAVEALVYQRSEIGYKVIVDNLYHGMIYQNQLYRPLEIGVVTTAYVNRVREDGKIDLMIEPDINERVDRLCAQIVGKLSDNNGKLPVSDSSTPELIKDLFACSKKDFKKAIGRLYKDHVIKINDDSIEII